jgi:hypothetical protein
LGLGVHNGESYARLWKKYDRSRRDYNCADQQAGPEQRPPVATVFALRFASFTAEAGPVYVAEVQLIREGVVTNWTYLHVYPGFLVERY